MSATLPWPSTFLKLRLILPSQSSLTAEFGSPAIERMFLSVPSRPVRPEEPPSGAKVADETDAKVRVVARRMCPAAADGAALLDGPVRQDHVVVADVVDAPQKKIPNPRRR